MFKENIVCGLHKMYPIQNGYVALSFSPGLAECGTTAKTTHNFGGLKEKNTSAIYYFSALKGM